MTQKFIYLILILSLISCTQQSKDYAKISGLIANNEAREISIIGKGFKKTITVDLDGSFSDTLKIKNNGIHTFYDGRTKQVLFLNNGNAINLNYDFKKGASSFIISGIGSETSNYLVQKNKFDIKERLNNRNAFKNINEDVFNTRISYLESKINKMLSNNKIDAKIKAKDQAAYKNTLSRIKQEFQKNTKLNSVLAKGKPSPKFYDYINYKGGKTSLDDLKGKYVYVDVWATWCGPCKQQIPFLAKIEKQYHNKNIEFVSISVDDARRNGNSIEKAKSKWKAMVKAKNMSGTQLFADKAFNSDFIKAYGIRSIPRFLLIDPNGNIVNSNAPRPSQESLKTLLDGIL